MSSGCTCRSHIGYRLPIADLSSAMSPNRPTLRVLCVMPGMTPDAGAERSLLDLAPALRDAGIELHLAVLTDRQALIPSLQELGVVIHDLSTARRIDGRMAALRSTVEEVAPALVHATLFEAIHVAQLASIFNARSRRVPLLITWASTVYSPEASHGVRWGRTKYSILRWWEIVLARAARSRYHAVTQGVADYNRRRLLVSSDRVRVGERGRDGAALRRAVGNPLLVRQEVGVGPSGRLIVNVGRQDLQKGQDALVRHFDRYAADHPDHRLAIVGRAGSGTAALTQALAKLEHPDSVVVLGHRDDVPTLIAAADAVVCSSLTEGAAGVLVEAMAIGTPVVSVPLEGLKDVLIDRQNARVVPLEGIPQALEEIFADADVTRQMTAAAQREASDRFSVDRAAGRLADIYFWAAGVPDQLDAQEATDVVEQ